MPRIIKPAVGSFTASNITIDSSGRVITASSGAGAANMQMVLFKQGPTSGTYNLDQTLQNFKLTLALAAAEAAEAETDQALKDNREDLEDLVSMLDLLQAEQVIVLLPEEQETEDQELQDLEVQEMQVEIQTLQI